MRSVSRPEKNSGKDSGKDPVIVMRSVSRLGSNDMRDSGKDGTGPGIVCACECK